MSNWSLLLGWRRQWNRNLFQFLSRRVRTPVDIEDLAQETYLRLLRAPDLTAVRNPQAYLLRVASHVVLEWRHRQPKSGSIVELEDELLVDESSPDFEVEAGISQELLDRALDECSPLMRSVLLLRLRDGYSCEEIAQALDITARQVKRYLARGYERLRAAVEN